MPGARELTKTMTDFLVCWRNVLTSFIFTSVLGRSWTGPGYGVNK